MTTVTVVARVVNEIGKYEVIESSDFAIKNGEIRNSRDFAGKPIGSTWLCEIRITDKGSYKVDSITRHDKSAATIHEIAAIESVNDFITKHSDPVAPVAATVDPVETTIIETPITTVTEHSHTMVADIAENNDSPEQPIKKLDRDMSLWQESDYYISPDAKLVFSVAYRMLQNDPYQSVKILMTGNSGYGKTTIAQRFAKYAQLDCMRVNCAIVRDTEEWYVDREIVEKNGAPVTKYSRTEFAQLVARGNCVIILDELNRIEPNIHNSLFPLLDDDGKTRMHHLEFKTGPNVIFVATVNLGYQYTGTFPIDDAMLNRFEFVLEVRAMPYESEVALLENRYHLSSFDSETVVTLATSLRDKDITCSTRDTLRVAKMVAAGMTVRDAFEYAVILRIPNDDTGAPIRKNITDLINTRLSVRAAEFAANNAPE